MLHSCIDRSFVKITLNHFTVQYLYEDNQPNEGIPRPFFPGQVKVFWKKKKEEEKKEKEEEKEKKKSDSV